MYINIYSEQRSLSRTMDGGPVRGDEKLFVEARLQLCFRSSADLQGETPRSTGRNTQKKHKAKHLLYLQAAILQGAELQASWAHLDPVRRMTLEQPAQQRQHLCWHLVLDPQALRQAAVGHKVVRRQSVTPPWKLRKIRRSIILLQRYLLENHMQNTDP